MDVTVEEARHFLLQAATEVKLSTFHTLLLHSKYFHIFLREHAISAPDCVDPFNYTVYREMPIQSYVTDSEFEAILNVIDTETAEGKRNAAIIMVAATTGMRVCDVIRMRLSYIDWQAGEIRISQKKRTFCSIPSASGCREYLGIRVRFLRHKSQQREKKYV